MRNAVALLITRDPGLIQTVSAVAANLSHIHLSHSPSIEEACPALLWSETDVLLIHSVEDNDVSRVTGITRDVAFFRRCLSTVVISEDYDPEQALEFLRLGVADVLERPLDSSRLAFLLDILTIRVRYGNPTPLESESNGIESLSSPDDAGFLFSPTQPLGRMIERVRRVAGLDINVLLQGETGTGKTRLARVIHALSPHHLQPNLTINCAALSPTVIESELFGHMKGAFTGADRDHIGKFAAVGKGTLFLDEIDSLSLTTQAKLLRVVEEHVFEPVGSNQSQPMQARLIVASNRPLETEVAEGRFRSDLFYRLNVVSFSLPPLREQRELVPALVRRFINEFNQLSGCAVRGLAPEAFQVLDRYDWPGNVRELRNAIERAAAVCSGGLITLDDLPDSVLMHLGAPLLHQVETLTAEPGESAPHDTLDTVKKTAEATRIVEALRRNQNNRSRTALELGISRMTLYSKMHRYGIGNGLEPPPDPASGPTV